MLEEKSILQLVSNFIQLTGGVRDHIELKSEIEKEDRLDLRETVQDMVRAIRGLERTIDDALLQLQSSGPKDLPVYPQESSLG